VHFIAVKKITFGLRKCLDISVYDFLKIAPDAFFVFSGDNYFWTVSALSQYPFFCFCQFYLQRGHGIIRKELGYM